MAPTVETIDGPVSGSQAKGVARFLGIPYAAPPFGRRRLRRPEPPQPWREPRDATRYGPTVPKPGYPAPFDALLPEPSIPGEDCLNLNVWAPEDKATAGRPVLVWIHGGAFTNGSGAVPTYDGTAFARDGVVCVTINYRLGADGFLDTGDGETNVGIRDQIAALQWVQANIAAFGGDPRNVTIAGESAGAMSVATLLASPRAAGLFRRAVLQSGAGHHALTRETAAKITADLAARLGTEPTREAIAAAPVGRLLEAAAQMSAEIQLLPDPSRWGEAAANLMPFEPVIDGDVVPDLPVRSIAAGAGRDVEVLIGTNSDEHVLFLEPVGALAAVDDNILRMTAGGYGFADVEEPIAVYAKEAGDSPGRTLAALMTDWFFRVPAIRLAEARAAAESHTWMYEFAWKSNARGGALGACHALELPFVFDTLDAEGSDWITGPDAPSGLAADMHGAWVRFASEGDPGWSPYTTGERAVRIFGSPAAGTLTDPASERRQLWEGLR